MGEETEIMEKKERLNKDLAEMIIRKLLTIISSYFLGKGLIDQSALISSNIDTLVGAAGILVSFFWSGKHQTKLKQKAEEAKPVEIKTERKDNETPKS